MRGAVLALALTAAASGTLCASANQPDGPPGVRRALQFENGLAVTLVFDPSAGAAAAAVAVAAGLNDDPPGRPGVAHLLEHLVLSGKGSRPESLIEHVRARGGEANARTTGLITEYYVSVAPEHLDAALARLAAGLLSPGVSMGELERELAAVDAEYAAGVRSAQRREMAVHRLSMNRRHPWSRAFGGNAASLGAADEELAAELRRFARQHYAPHRMALTLVAPLPLAVLERAAGRYFARLDARPWQAVAAEPLVEPDSLPWLTQIRAKGSHVLTFWFPVPVRSGCAARDAHGYLLSLIRSSGPDGLGDSLKNHGWILRHDGHRVETSHHDALVGVRFQLTPAGSRRVDEIGAMLFAYLRHIAVQGLEPGRLEQWNRATQLFSRYSEQRSAADRARAISEQVLTGGDTCTAVTEFEVVAALEHYRPDNLFVAHIHPDAPAERTIRTYPARYHQGALPAQWLAHWLAPQGRQPLRLPALSPYDPLAQAPLAPIRSQPLMRIAHAPRLDLWHAADARLHTPRASLEVELNLPSEPRTVMDAVHLELLAAAFSDTVRRTNELAQPFDYHAGISSSPNGIKLRLSGFTGAWHEFAGAVLTALSEVRLEPASFDRYAEQVLGRHAALLSGSRPLRVLERELRNVVLMPAADHQALAAAAGNLSYAAFTDWHQAFLQRAEARALAVGALSQEQALTLRAPLTRLLRAGHDSERPLIAAQADVSRWSSKPGAPRSAAVAHGGIRQLGVRHPDVALTHHLQAPDARMQTHAGMLLLGPLLDGYMKRALRDQAQLSYLVAVKPAPFGELPAAMISLQSPRADAGQLLETTRAHFHGFARYLKAMPEEYFARFRAAAVERLARAPTSLDELRARAWREVTSYGYESDPRQRLLQILPRLTRHDVLALHRALQRDLEQRSLVLVSPGRGGR